MCYGAAVHRSYLDHNNIQIAIYDDRLEITSPGKLPMGQTIERMKEGYSRIRNEAIAYAFSYINLIEHWGSGIPRIIREVQAAGLESPEFIGGEVDLRINIYRKQDVITGNTELAKKNFLDLETINTTAAKISKNDSDDSTETDIKSSEPGTETDTEMTFTDTEKKLISLIKDNTSITLDEMASSSGLSKSGVRYALNQLRNRGVVIREGSQKKGRWVLIHG